MADPDIPTEACWADLDRLQRHALGYPGEVEYGEHEERTESGRYV
jgi:hypothetical protein